ncbi:MAG: hypothetical protein K6348_09215 [Deferribacterales bacterium]
MKETVLEMKRKLIILEDMESQDILNSELGISYDEYELKTEQLYQSLSDEDKLWVDNELASWVKEYIGFLGGKSCPSGGCSSCSGHHN